jgi:hypothetical protein
MRLKLASWDIDTGTGIRTVKLARQKAVRGCLIKHGNIHSPHINLTPVRNAAMHVPAVNTREGNSICHPLANIITWKHGAEVPVKPFQG